jgi:hypothetical protein
MPVFFERKFMNLSIKNSLIAFIISSGTIVAMEKETTHTLMINDKANMAMYCTTGWHFHRQVPKNLPSYTKDPLILCIITNLKTQDTSDALIAVKYLFAYHTTEPLLNLKIKLDKNEHSRKIMVRCVKNPNLDGDSFFIQLKNAMIPIYRLSPWVLSVYEGQSDDRVFCLDNKKDFITAGVLVKKKINDQTIWAHGPNGCPNEEALLTAQFKDVIKPRIPFILWFLKNYQCDQQNIPEDIMQLIATALQFQPSSVTITKSTPKKTGVLKENL